MEDDLPADYDVVVVGTGMTESIVAAAASRIGKRVLHLDSNEYYGGLWASFNFDGLQTWMEDCHQPNKISVGEPATSVLKPDESLVKAGSQFSTVTNIQENWFIVEQPCVVKTVGEISLHRVAGAKNCSLELPDSQGQSSTKDTQTEASGEGNGECSKSVESEKLDKEGSNCEKPDVGDSQILAPREHWSQTKLKKEYRKFNLDLAPKLLFARGSLVELLISSNIARYAEFRSVTRVLTWLNSRLEPVPCSRADVFSTQHVSVVEKRMLMKLLTSCLENEDTNKEFEGFEDRTFVEYLKSKKLTSNLMHYVLYAIAMATESTMCMDGVARTQRFLNSLGRYGNTPFLWPMYGSGEIPQCFCRLCAVFGGLYHLKRAADAIIINSGEGKCTGIVSGQQRLETQNLVMGVGYAPPEFLKSTPSGGLSRGIFVTDRSIHPADKESLTLLQFPPLDGAKEPVTVIEVGHSTNACPKGLYVVHMTCKQQINAREDLQAVVAHLLHAEFYDGTLLRIDTDTQSTQTASASKPQDGSSSENQEPSMQGGQGEREEKPAALKPQVLWSLYFNCPETSQCNLSADVPSNVFLCSGPDLDLDFEFAVAQAKEIFTKMYPESEFLPRAPDPEEIVLDGEEGAEAAGTSNEANTEGADAKEETLAQVNSPEE